jgi:hypothetical protein
LRAYDQGYTLSAGISTLITVSHAQYRLWTDLCASLYA